MKEEAKEFVDFAVTARKYKTLLTKKFQNRKVWNEPSAYEIQSFIPGTIIEIRITSYNVCYTKLLRTLLNLTTCPDKQSKVPLWPFCILYYR